VSSVRSLRGRVSLAVMVIAALVGVFVFRLVDLQVVKANDLNAASLSQRSDVVTTFGDRGSILDANGVVLAGSVLRYTITASPRFAATFSRTPDPATGATVDVSVAEAAAEVATAAGKPAAEVLAALTADPTSDYAVLAKSIDVDAYNAVRALVLTVRPRPAQS
jgi:cell division protein FtsI (penicillin-binding protein 3)